MSFGANSAEHQALKEALERRDQLQIEVNDRTAALATRAAQDPPILVLVDARTHNVRLARER